ncbi:hypothetical protein HHI36_001753, partial [Cryptolaemus montrouzieri]
SGAGSAIYGLIYIGKLPAAKVQKNLEQTVVITLTKTKKTHLLAIAKIIEFYNKTKGGVDPMDQMVGSFNCKRQTIRRSFAVFKNIFDKAGLDAFFNSLGKFSM